MPLFYQTSLAYILIVSAPGAGLLYMACSMYSALALLKVDANPTSQSRRQKNYVNLQFSSRSRRLRWTARQISCSTVYAKAL